MKAPSKVIIILFMGFFVIPMLAIGGLLDILEVPFNGDQENDDQQNT